MAWEVEGQSRLGSKDQTSPYREFGVIQIKLNNNESENLSSPKTQRPLDSS